MPSKETCAIIRTRARLEKADGLQVLDEDFARPSFHGSQGGLLIPANQMAFGHLIYKISSMCTGIATDSHPSFDWKEALQQRKLDPP